MIYFLIGWLIFTVIFSIFSCALDLEDQPFNILPTPFKICPLCKTDHSKTQAQIKEEEWRKKNEDSSNYNL